MTELKKIETKRSWFILIQYSRIFLN